MVIVGLIVVVYWLCRMILVCIFVGYMVLMLMDEFFSLCWSVLENVWMVNLLREYGICLVGVVRVYMLVMCVMCVVGVVLRVGSRVLVIEIVF